MKKTLKVVSVFLAIAMILTLLPLNVFAVGGTCGANMNWTYSDGVLTLTGSGTMNTFSAYDSPWAEYEDDITSVSIASGITSIGTNAFRDCNNLKSITFPSSITQITANSFNGSGLETVTFEGSYVDQVVTTAFSGVKGASFHFPAGFIVNYKRSGSNYINEPFVLSTDNYQTYFGAKNYAFFSGSITVYWVNEDGTILEIDPNVTSGTTPTYDGATPTKSGNYVFDTWTPAVGNITSDMVYKATFAEQQAAQTYPITIYQSDNGTVVADKAEAAEGETVTLTATPATGYDLIGYEGRYYIYEDGIPYPVGMDEITFTGNTFVMPAAEVTIYAQFGLLSGQCGDNAYWNFDKTTGILSITGSGSMYDYEMFSNPAPWLGYNITGISIANTITYIGDYAFAYNSALQSVTVPSGVTAMGDSVFCYCTALQSAVIPDTVTSIGEGTFNYCRSLSNVTWPGALTSIPARTFSDCSSLTSFTFSSAVTSIGNDAFARTGLVSVTVHDGVAIGSDVFRQCASLASVTLPSDLTVINSGLFGFCEALTEIDIPDTVTSIGQGAFCWSGLTEIVIPDSVTYIGNQAFQGCADLASVVMSENIETIERDSFRECTSLTALTIPASIKLINYAFFGTPFETIYLYAKPSDFTWNYFNQANDHEFKTDGTTEIHVIADYLDDYETNFTDIYAVFVGDIVITNHDINDDGIEDINDISFIISAAAGNSTMTSSQLAKADLNSDGVVDGFDAAWLDRYIFS